MSFRFKIFALIAAMLVILSGCNKTTQDEEPAPPVSSQRPSSGGSTVVTVGGDEVTIDTQSGFSDPVLGFGFVYSDMIKNLIPDNFGIAPAGSNCVMAMYAPDAVINILSRNDIGEDELNDAYNRYYQCFAIVRCSNEVGDEGTSLLPQLREIYANELLAAELEGNKYYYFYNDNYTDAELTAEEKTAVDTLNSEMAGLKNNIFVFVPEIPKGASFEEFTASALTGETITQEIFADYTVTMINIWATWCNPCIDELPDIQDMMDELPEGANIITICLDADMDTELAMEMADSIGLSMPVLMPSESLQRNVLRYVDAVPATYFVNSDGKIIGQPMVGAPIDPKAAYMERIESVIDALEGGNEG